MRSEGAKEVPEETHLNVSIRSFPDRDDHPPPLLLAPTQTPTPASNLVST